MTFLSPHRSDFTAARMEAIPRNGEDRGRSVRCRIAELEGILVRARSIGAARIAESCSLQRRLDHAREGYVFWTAKAEDASRAGRQDLAKAATDKAQLANDEAVVLTEQIAGAGPLLCDIEAKIAQIEFALRRLRQVQCISRNHRRERSLLRSDTNSLR